MVNKFMKPVHDIQNLPNGIIHNRKGDFQTTIIEKQDTVLRLKLLSPESTEWQALIDLANPSKLLCPFMRVMMLMLLWHPEPRRIHVLGLGGGRIPAFLRKLFPALAIDCTEIDKDIYDLAVKFFSFRTDPQLNVIIEDGREFLTSRMPDAPYDAILIDAFTGVGFSPVRLATQEFLRICKKQLHQNGTLVVNLLPSDDLVAERLATIESVFRTVSVSLAEDAFVVFASDAERESIDELAKRAVLLHGLHKFDFPYASLARSIVTIPCDNAGTTSVAKPQLLTDATPPTMPVIAKSLLKSLGRNDQCPCGSGRKFKKCHGSN